MHSLCIDFTLMCICFAWIQLNNVASWKMHEIKSGMRRYWMKCSAFLVLGSNAFQAHESSWTRSCMWTLVCVRVSFLFCVWCLNWVPRHFTQILQHCSMQSTARYTHWRSTLMHTTEVKVIAVEIFWPAHRLGHEPKPVYMHTNILIVCIVQTDSILH